MHVAYIHQYFATKSASTGTRSYAMAQRLIARGHKVTMICGVTPNTRECFDVKDRVTYSKVDGIDVACIAEPYANKMSYMRRVLAFFRFAKEAERVLLEVKPDLIFATSTPLTVGIPARKAARKLGKPFVFEVRDLWPELPIAMGILKDPFSKWYLRRMEHTIYHAATRIIGLSPGMCDGIARTGFPRDRIHMVPNGCDLEDFVPTDEPLDDPRFGDKDDFRLVFAGAHGLANGLDAVIDAAAELKRRGVKGVRLVFIGEGKLKPRLVQRSSEMGLQEICLWHDPIPKRDLARILPRMDVGMQILLNTPAFYYGTSPNKFFDYLSSGIPVLNNYPGWLADMIEKHQIGKAAPPADPKAFADAVVWLSEQRSELPAMGRRARALGEAEFSRAKLSDDFAGVLERAAAEGARR